MPLSYGLERLICVLPLCKQYKNRNMFRSIKNVTLIHPKKLHSWNRFCKTLCFVNRHCQKLNVFLTEHLNIMFYFPPLQTAPDPIGVRLTVSSIPIANCMYMCFLNTCLLMGLDAFLGLIDYVYLNWLHYLVQKM